MQAGVFEEGLLRDEILTMDVIERRFDGEWVLIEDPELTDQLKVIRGEVLWHSKDRDEVYEKAIELRPKHAAFRYLGEPPEGMEYVL